MSGTKVRRRRGVLGLVLGLTLGLLLSMVAALGWASPGAASSGAVGEPAERPGRLAITSIGVSCECGGVGYLWGWRAVAVSFEGGRDGYRYQLAVKGRRTVEADWYGYASVTRDQVDFEAGRSYRFRIKELKRGKVVRATPWQGFRIPRPVGHPTWGGLETVTLGDEEVLVAGRTHRITFEGDWAEGARFASGVDYYRGASEGDDRFGYYEEEDYPLPWSIGSEQPIVELTPPEEFAGTIWNVLVVGYLPAPKADPVRGIAKGDPLPGTEWGWRFSVRVASADEIDAP